MGKAASKSTAAARGAKRVRASSATRSTRSRHSAGIVDAIAAQLELLAVYRASPQACRPILDPYCLTMPGRSTRGSARAQPRPRIPHQEPLESTAVLQLAQHGESNRFKRL